VVVLGVVLENLGPLLVVKSAYEFLDAYASVLGPPLLAVDKPRRVSQDRYSCPCTDGHIHLLRQLDIELSCTEKAQL